MSGFKKEDVKDIYYLSPMQEGMLFHYILERDTDAYIEQYKVDLKGVVDKELLEKSFNMLMERYDILRTVFIYEKVKRPLQVVLKNRSLTVYYEDLSALSENDRNVYLEGFIEKDIKKGFDLSKDILLRVSLIKTGPEEYKLIFNHHHILMDGWCSEIIFRELFDVYKALLNKQAIKLDNTYPYSSYIKWLESRDKKEMLDFWVNYLDGYDNNPDIPGKISNKSGMYLKEEIIFDLGEDLTAGLTAFAARNRVTINSVLESVWAFVLMKFNNCNDYVFGRVVSGRTSEVQGIES
ncbi:MAG: non-ribosomal peptide synthetase, partial [Clostridiaceae bacterium]|nr:non-ribosomal peptide synthetase [Clostridiaceae bacterium]